jgi:fructose-1,6-bisphosphatase/inositol monophosphatase family enzyme
VHWAQFKKQLILGAQAGLQALNGEKRELGSVILANHEDRSPTRAIDMIVLGAIVSQIDENFVLVFGEDLERREYKGQRFFAVIDPVDGTTNFSRGITNYCISVAGGIIGDGVPTIGKIDLAIIIDNFGNFYYCDETREPKKNNIPISCSNVDDIAAASVRISSIYRSDAPLINSKIGSIIYLGATALELAHLASGGLDVYIETKMRKVFDFAAAIYLVECAGGTVTDDQGRSLREDAIDMDYRSSLFVAANSSLHRQLFN